MQPIRSFVVRIYRHDGRTVVGVVEDVRTGRSRSFRSLSGLWAALTRRWRAKRSEDGASAASDPNATPR
jgi:hypothetical protein